MNAMTEDAKPDRDKALADLADAAGRFVIVGLGGLDPESASAAVDEIERDAAKVVLEIELSPLTVKCALRPTHDDSPDIPLFEATIDESGAVH